MVPRFGALKRHSPRTSTRGGVPGGGKREEEKMKVGRTKTSVVWKVAAALILGAGVFFLARQGADLVPRVMEAVRGLGPWAAIAFIAFYAVATVAWVAWPGEPSSPWLEPPWERRWPSWSPGISPGERWSGGSVPTPASQPWMRRSGARARNLSSSSAFPPPFPSRS